MAQLVASMSSVVLGGVVEVVGSNLARGGVVEVVGSNLARGKFLFQWMASISFASESLMDPRIQMKLDTYQKCGNIISQTSLLYIYIYIFFFGGGGGSEKLIFLGYKDL